jgi:ElaB/YqjD/DUF883 family membrane-anchored ribosome-binding protein
MTSEYSGTSTERTPAQVRAEAERTQEDLRRNVHELNERANPARVVGRQVEGMQSSLGRMRQRVMGAPQMVAQTGEDASSSIRGQAKGNPLAAGAVALGVGWIIGGLLPVTEAEKSKVSQLGTQAREQAQPLMDKAADQVQPAMDKVNQAVAPE